MPLFGEANTERIQEILADLHAQGKPMKEWLVKALILEYLPCRCFVEKDTWVLIDYSSVTTHEVEAIIQHPYVILNGITLLHNITEDLAKDRMIVGPFGIAPLIMPSNPSLFLAEGQVSKYHFPYHVPSITDCDWKLKFNERSLVVEGSDTFQWIVTSNIQGSPMANVLNTKQLQELHHIYDEVNHIGRQPYPINTMDIETLRQELEKVYGELEALRDQMRATVLSYHNHSKMKPDAKAYYTKDEPPKLTLFDDLDVEPDGQGKNHYVIRTYVEPLFFRSAYRAAADAEIHSTFITKDQYSAMPLAEEIEASAESIMFSIMCLEAYINGFAKDYSTLWTSQWEKGTELRDKWLGIPDDLGNPNCFDTSRPPYQYFAQMVGWRNDYLAHYKHTSKPPLRKKPLGYVSNIYSIFNAKNARKATDTVIEMIRRINDELGKQVPSWVQLYSQGNTLWLTSPEVDRKRKSFTYGTGVNEVDPQIPYLKDKIVQVLPLLGQDQANILQEVWHVSVTEQGDYQEAQAEYQRVMQLIATKCNEVLKKQGLI